MLYKLPLNDLFIIRGQKFNSPNFVAFFLPFSFFCLALAFWNHTCATRLCIPALLAIFSMACESGFISSMKCDWSICIWSSVKQVRGRLARGFEVPSLLLVSVCIVSGILAPKKPGQILNHDYLIPNYVNLMAIVEFLNSLWKLL